MNGVGSLEIHNLGVAYLRLEALTGISLQVQPGRLTGIIGPNGAGKTTLLKAMLGLIGVREGLVLYHDKPLQKQLELVAYVPQRSQIDWTYPATVWDVVMMGRVRKTGWFRSFSPTSRRLVEEALGMVGMNTYKDRPIGQLSGGQQQRVFLARSLVQEADIFCFDEPFGGIDWKTEKIIFDILHELAAAGKIVLVVNHDLGESITNFEDLILLNRELIAAGKRENVLTDNHLYRAYRGKVVFLTTNNN